MLKKSLFLALLALILLLVGYMYVQKFPRSPANNLGQDRPYDMRVGTRFTKAHGDVGVLASLRQLELPLFPGGNSIWGASGRDDRGHIWIGVSVQGADAAHLIEYIPEDNIFVDHGDPVTALRSAGLYREGETQTKIHSKIIQADDGYLYFSSMDEHGEVADGSRLPTWGSHLWRYRPDERRWEHLFKAPEGLVAVSGVGRWMYALGYWDHVLYQYDTHTGQVASVRVGSEGGHVSRNFVADIYGNAYVPRVELVGDVLVTSLVQFKSTLQEVATTPLIHYAGKGKPQRHHGIVGLSYLADNSIIIVTGRGYLYRIVPSEHGRAGVEELGWIHPEGASYTAAVFPLDGATKLLAVGKSKRRGSGYALLEYDIAQRTSRVVELDIPKLKYLLLYGSNTRDDSGNFYIVGRHDWDTPLVWQLVLGTQTSKLGTAQVADSVPATSGSIPEPIVFGDISNVQSKEVSAETPLRETWSSQEQHSVDSDWTVPILVAVGAGIMGLLTAVLLHGRGRRSVVAPGETKNHSGVPNRYVSTLDNHAIEIHDKEHAVKFIGYEIGEARRVDYADVSSFEIQVNEDTVLEVSRQLFADFSREQITELRTRLLQVQKERMDAASVRRIDLSIRYALEAPFVHTLNFYLRQGNYRKTPRSYADTIEDVVTWCELLASVLSSQEERQIPGEDPHEAISPTLAVEEETLDSRATPPVVQETPPGGETPISGTVSLADELDRLVRLLDRDFLTEEEFRKAKKKLLGE